MKAYFQVLDTPEVPEVVKGTGAQIVEGSIQTTNSWGLRGPEPDRSAAWQGIVLGDSYMQGLFVDDDQTPVECLKRDLTERLGEPVEILNTGHLGYSPEQYYYTLMEYEKRFPPSFVVVSLFANDFGEFQDVLEGRGDWSEASYWIGLIRDYCIARECEFLVVPAPWVNQIEGPQRQGNYPGKISNALHLYGVQFLDPIADFADTQLELRRKARILGSPITPSPLFNGRIGDGHFSTRGAEVWAAAVGRRLALAIKKRELVKVMLKKSRLRAPSSSRR